MSSPYPLHGWSAVITGGGSGIGLGGARALLKSGCTVTIAGRTLDRLEKAKIALASDIPPLSPAPEVHLAQCDATKEDEVEALMKTAFENGGGRLDIVVLSAGGGDPEGGGLRLLANTDLKSFENTINLNLTSTFLAIKHAAPFMKKSLASNPSSGPRFRTASIIALSSIAGTAYHEHGGPYCVAKAGVDHLVRNAAGELGKFRIRVNSIQPGLVKTELADGLVKDPDTMADYLDNMPLGRLGETDDCGDLIRFLAGPESSWITGASIPVDGGQHLERGPRWHVLAEKVYGKGVSQLREV